MDLKNRLITYIDGMSILLLDMDLDRSTLEGMALKDLESLAYQLDHIYWNS